MGFCSIPVWIYLDSQTIEDFIWTNLKFLVSKLKVPTLNSKRSFFASMTKMVTKQQRYFNFGGRKCTEVNNNIYLLDCWWDKIIVYCMQLFTNLMSKPIEFENRVTWLKSNLNMMNIYKVNWHTFLDVTLMQWMSVQLPIVYFFHNKS